MAWLDFPPGAGSPNGRHLRTLHFYTLSIHFYNLKLLEELGALPLTLLGNLDVVSELLFQLVLQLIRLLCDLVLVF